MRIPIKKTGCRARAAFTLVEVMMAFGLMVMVMTGVFFSYSQANRMAEFSSMSLAAQSVASQGIERARSAQWDSQAPTNGVELPATNATTPVLPPTTNTLDVPQSGAPLTVINYVYETTNEANPPLWELKSVAVWTFPLTGKQCTNTVVTLRAPDE
ncbi:MAG TPA: prepilin-type N-terminal cleavage/methylation domain-containing protein [Verrucomicrobiae bacterium]|jgi:type II secretory pathway pseudopilin PulG